MDEFTACDACGVRSYVFVELPSGRDLAYCGSHGRQYDAGLRAAGAKIIDLRYAIAP